MYVKTMIEKQKTNEEEEVVASRHSTQAPNMLYASPCIYMYVE